MKRIERTLSIILLFIISYSNVSTPVVYAAEAKIISFPKTASSSATRAKPVAPPKFNQPASKSVLGASTSLFEIGTQEGNQTSASQRIPIRMQQLSKKVYDTDENVTLAITNPDNDPFTTAVTDIQGKAVNVPIIETNDGTSTDVQLQASNEIHPGKYTIKVTDQEGDVTTQDFSWGVLAMNTDKTEYHPNETANISFGVLDDSGGMVCNSNLTLQITNAAFGINDTLSTGNSRIQVNEQCQKHDFSLQPDYSAQYQFAKAGTYTFTLSASTGAGAHSISQTIPVTNDIPFDVQRVSATRIYPLNTYPMTFNITAHKDFSGIVTETVPQDFTITPASESANAISYDNMQTVYLNANDPGVQLSQAIAASASAGGLVMPFHGDYPITQGFGAQMTDPTLQAFYTQYGLAGHDGVDFGVPMNTSLYAVDDGTIMQAGSGDYGTTIIIQHAWGESYYGHLSTTAVKVGDHITKGELIGYSGESGEATGPHLHFGMKPLHPDTGNGYYGKVDPLPYLPYDNAQASSALSTLNPALADATVLGASDSANSNQPTPGLTGIPTPAASVSAAVSPLLSPTVAVTPTATISRPVVSAIPSTPLTTVSSPNFQIRTGSSSANEDFSVLDKQILMSEELANSSDTEKVKVITWHVSLRNGQSTTLGYDYQAPHVSPQFYLLGPMQFYQNRSNKVVFQEQRQWQIASDDVGVEWYSNNTGNKWNGYSWQYRKKIDINHSSVAPVNSVFSDGFESGNFNNWNGGANVVVGTGTGTAATVQTGTVKTGTYAAKIVDVSGGTTIVDDNFGSSTNASVQGDINLSSVSATGLDFALWTADTNFTDVYGIGFDSSNHICLNNNGTITCSATATTLNTWHHYQIHVVVSGTVGVLQVFYDGTLVSDLNQININTGTLPMNLAGIGDGDGNITATFYVDNVTEASLSTLTTATYTTPVIDNHASGSTTSSNNFTWAQTIGSHSNMIALVGVETYAGNHATAVTFTISGTTYNMTNLFRESNGSSGMESEIWTYPSPVSGAATFKVTMNAIIQTVAGSATFYNVNLSNPLGTYQGAFGTGSGSGTTTASVTLSTTSNQVIFDSFSYLAGGGPWSAGSGQTSLWNTATVNGAAGSYKTSSGTSTTMSWSLANTTDTWAELAVPINPLITITNTSQSATFMDSGGDANNTNTGTNILAANGGGFYNFSSGAVAADCTKSETGPCSYKFTSSSGGAAAYIEKDNVISDLGSRISEYVNFSNLPSSGNKVDVLEVDDSGDNEIFGLYVTSGGILQLYNFTHTTQYGSNGPTLSTGTWYRLSVSYNITSTTTYSIKVYVNGVQYISVNNSTALPIIGSTELFLGWDRSGNGNSDVVNIDDIYVDNGNDLSDTGDIHVTAKRPLSNGTTNTFATRIGAGSSGYGSGHAPEVNERPLATANGWTGAHGTTDEYTIENASQGDVDISSYYPIADEAWIYGSWTSGTGSCTAPTIINNGTSTSVASTISSTTAAMATNISNNSYYPLGNTDVGMGSCTDASGTHSVNLYEAGMQIAYTQTDPNSYTDFPVLINISGDTSLSNHANGTDILFTDSTGENLLPYEIEKYSAGTLQAWVKIPNLSADTDTIIYMYYGNPSATSLASNTTWNSNYLGVYHLGQNLNDSTSNTNTATNPGGTGSPASGATGQIDGAESFSAGTGDTVNYLSLPDSTSLHTFTQSSYTMSAWVNPSTTPPTNGHQEYQFIAKTGFDSGPSYGNGGTQFYSTIWDSNDNPYYAISVGSYAPANWYFVQQTVNLGSDSESIYVNGSLQGITFFNGFSGSLYNYGTNPTLLGQGSQSDSCSDTTGFPFCFKGTMDEVELSNVAVNGGWLATQYSNESFPSSFSSVGGQETSIYAPTMAQVMRHGEWFSAEGAVQPFTF